MRFIKGAPNKVELRRILRGLNQFETYLVLEEDQSWAEEQLIRYTLSDNVGVADALIASLAYRLRLPLYTRNTKHYRPLIPDLAKRPNG